MLISTASITKLVLVDDQLFRDINIFIAVSENELLMSRKSTRRTLAVWSRYQKYHFLIIFDISVWTYYVMFVRRRLSCRYFTSFQAYLEDIYSVVLCSDYYHKNAT